jgi:hypothetical protein
VSTPGQVVIRLNFPAIEDRDAFVDTHFPRRDCTVQPGCFKIPGWGFVVVFLERVTLCPYNRTARKAGL